ncbi:MAG TPA: beta-ketoacyl-ACP synthase III [Candidatus Aminicenantes bacterium]|nr:beta-ketoacyl-ACP synthase III [Candidatus Aminicenantes bacterium]HRY66080.1 beta-ketoacyl-ACP synthase III [Candidatus Aminicenantes bacterium]HRZ72871.1 beta-ketoacyl-ACP synthase III [Candidatus Aminicenantes bacterium]
MSAPRTVITGTGHYVPPRIVTNHDLEKVMNTSDEWIRERSGIVERHHVEPGVTTSDLAVEAARRAMADARIDPSTVDFVIAATLSPDHYFPGIGVLIQAKLGLGTTGALDVRNQCSGFIYALSVGDQFIKTGQYKRILLVAAEVQSGVLDYSDKGRDMSVLFGDGAGAVILEPSSSEDDRGILSTHLYADGHFASHLWMEKPSAADHPTFQQSFFDDGRFFPRMEGRNVFVNACQRMPEAIRAGLDHNGLALEDIDALIPHQANDRISLQVAKGLKIPLEKVIRNIDRYGNTTAASIPIALDEAVKDGRIKRGDLVAIAAFGSGYTWASAFLRW